MLRRFNYTGRRKILHEHVPVSLTGSKPVWGFDIDLGQIGTYELPAGARIYVEAYEQASYMRFDFGTIGGIVAPPKEGRILSEFEGSDGVHFRVKVVDPASDAKLLAEADGILPLAPEETEENRLPLLPVRHQDLGQELWRIGFEEGSESRPTLLVNEFILDRTAFVRSPAFIVLVWPTILREILVRILVIDDYRELDDQDDWRCLWLKFARRFIPGRGLPGAGPENQDESFEWIRNAVTAFSEKNGLLTRYKEDEKEEADGGAA